MQLFEQSDLNDIYFEWFTAGVKSEEVKDIYDRIGMSISDELLAVNESVKGE